MSTEYQIEDNEKYIAVSAYITPAGWIVAYLFKWISNINSHYCIFHLKQGLGQTVVFGLIWICMSYVDWYFINEIAKLAYIILQTIGVLNALNKKCAFLPVLGKLYNKCITIIK